MQNNESLSRSQILKRDLASAYAEEKRAKDRHKKKRKAQKQARKRNR